MKIRPTQIQDLSSLSKVLDGTELFPSEMLPEMIQGFLSGNSKEDIWLTCEVDAEAIGFCYAVSEQLAEGTWNMLAIAVLPEKQGKGVGKAIVKALESSLRSNGNRILIADTSGTEAFTKTRNFYENNGYTEEARIRDFWASGDDKVTFWKSL